MFELQILQKKLVSVKEEFNKSKMKFETDRANFETEQNTLQEELDVLRNISREYGIQKDVFREKELELKRQLLNAETELCNIKLELNEKLKQKSMANEDLMERIQQSENKFKILENKLESYSGKDVELERLVSNHFFFCYIKTLFMQSAVRIY